MVHVNTGALTELFACGKSGTPVIVPLPSGELLLSKENVGIFIGADGKPSRKVHPQWHPRPCMEFIMLRLQAPEQLQAFTTSRSFAHPCCFRDC